jgi:hypothetical protein
MSDDAALLWVFELKTFTQDHHDQLGRYRDWATREHAKSQKIYVYITPDGDEPQQEEERCRWMRDSFQRVLNILDGLSVGNDRARKIIEDYSDAVRRRFYLGSQSQNKGVEILCRFAGETTAGLLQAYPEVEEIYKDEFASLKRLEAVRARLQRAA